MSKVCTFCKTLRPLTEYYTYKSGPRAGKVWSQCKACRKEQLYGWRKAKPEHYKKLYTRGRYRSVYGLDLEYVKRFGECPICLKEKKLVVDHCHSGGQVRDFICLSCNTLLGHLENPEKLDRTVHYLTKHKAPVHLTRVVREPKVPQVNSFGDEND